MGEKKRIDRLFQEHFKDFEMTPDPALWTNIEAQLGNTKKKRRIIPIWWRYAGTAAALAILLSIGAYSMFNDTSPTALPKIVLEPDSKTSTKAVRTEKHILKHKTSQKEVPNKVAAARTTISDVTTKATPQTSTSSKTSNSTVAHSNKAPSYTNIPNISKNTSVKAASKSKTTNTNKIAATNTTTPTVTHSKTTSSHLNGTVTPQHNVATNKTRPSQNLNTIASHANTVALSTDNAEAITTTTNDSIAAPKQVSIEEAIAATNAIENKDEELSPTIENKWRVAPNVAPVYFNSLSHNGSALNAQFDNNSKSGEVNLSYGINASYALNKKVTIRSGINRINLGFNTNDVIALRNNVPSDFALNNLESIPNLPPPPADAIATENNTVSLLSAESVNANRILNSNATTTSINQSFDFIEVPLEIEYALSSKRLGVSLIGGFSSFFLNNANASSEIDGQVTDLEPTNNINKTSYSANLGLGLNYKISKKIDFNLEPLFKYQINTFRTTSGNFQPFIIGVYTGFGIKL